MDKNILSSIDYYYIFVSVHCESPVYVIEIIDDFMQYNKALELFDQFMWYPHVEVYALMGPGAEWFCFEKVADLDANGMELVRT